MGSGASRRDPTQGQMSAAKMVFIGLGVSIAATLVLSFIGGIVISIATVHPSTVATAIPMIGYVSAGIGGLYAGRKSGENGLRNGAGVGIAYTLLLILISTTVVREPFSAAVVATRGLSTLIVAALGGIIGVNT